MVKYVSLESETDLVNFIVNRVIEVGNIGDPYKFGTVDFKVEETPLTKNTESFTTKDFETAWDAASGAYGITTTSLFDQTGIQLVMGYYGGSEGIQSVYFDDDFEISKDDAFDKISYAISEILALEPARYHRNFLVKVID